MSSDPNTIADKGMQIYAAKYQQNFEAEHRGQFVAIDVQSEEAFVRATPEAALRAAQEKNPKAMFYLIKVGSPGVFRFSHSPSRAQGGNRISGR